MRAAAVLVAAAAVLAGCGVHVPSPTPSPSTAPSSSQSKPAAPKATHAGPGTVTGRILDNGKPVAGATVQVLAWPKGAVLDKLHNGQKVPTKRLGHASSTGDGSYTVKLARTGGRYRDGRVLNVEVDVFARSGSTQWNVSLRLMGKGKHADKTKPIRLSFDLGRRTVTVGGHKSRTQVVH